MPNDGKLPRGIRNNNPGNLRGASGPDFKTTLTDGFATFSTLGDGVQSFFWLVTNYYNALGLKTLPQFIGRYAPASENDVTNYVRIVGTRLAIPPSKWATLDLRLDIACNALDFARAIFLVECGRPPSSWPSYPEWIGPRMLLQALIQTEKWNVT